MFPARTTLKALHQHLHPLQQLRAKLTRRASSKPELKAPEAELATACNTLETFTSEMFKVSAEADAIPADEADDEMMSSFAVRLDSLQSQVVHHTAGVKAAKKRYEALLA